MQFVEWFTAVMDKYGLTYYRVSKMSGVHQTTLKSWASGTKPQEDKMQAVKVALERYIQEHGGGLTLEEMDGDKLPEPNVGIKKDPAIGGAWELSDLQKEAWDLILQMDSETLRKFIAGAKAMLEV